MATTTHGDRPFERLPTGTVTFLRTDVEGSMRLVRALGSGWDAVNAIHLGLIRRAVEVHGGAVVRTEGDALFAAFGEAGAAGAAALAAQRAMRDHAWPVDGGLAVRMGLHTGEAHLAGDDYGGFDVNRAARVAATGHGGQIVVSGPTAGLIADSLPPDARLRDLGEHALKDVPRPERLFQLEADGLPSVFPPLRTDGAAAADLPERLTSFVGRERDVTEVAGLLVGARLVTLTGPGGIGKTSLAVEVARSIAAEFPDGVWFVALGELDDPALLPSAIARALGMRDGPERAATTALEAFVADRSLLLVLDNFEHVLDAAPTIAALLRAGPGPRIIVTSRAALRIGGEQEYPVRPLGVGGAGDGADGADEVDAPGLRLFVDRARALRPGWDPMPDREAIAEVVRLLDGLPLGIELAAARTTLLPIAAIRERLAARLPLPGSGPRDVPARQRTLDAAIGWSYDLLDPREQELLADLAVFEGSFDLTQARAVAGDDTGGARGDVLDGLMTLADHSLVVPVADASVVPLAETAEGIRVRLLGTIQAYATGRLAAGSGAAAARRRHALAYLALAEAAAPHLPGTEQVVWLDRLALDLPNIRSAMRWSIEAGDVDIALRFTAALWRFWQMEGHLHEGRQLSEAALAMPGADASTAARLGAVAALGNIAYWQADPEQAGRWYREQLGLARELGDDVAEADAVFNIGHVLWVGGPDPVAVSEWLDDATARFERLGNEKAIARCEWGRASILVDRADPHATVAVFERLLPTFERLGDVQYAAMTLSSLGWAAFLAGDLPRAARMTLAGLAASHRLRDIATTTISLYEGVVLATALGRTEMAATLSGAYEALCDRYGVRPPMALDQFLDGLGLMADDRRMLADARYDDAKAAGSRLTLDEAVALTLSLGDDDAFADPTPGGQ